jgi:hypothetical protein
MVINPSFCPALLLALLLGVLVCPPPDQPEGKLQVYTTDVAGSVAAALDETLTF